MDEPTGSSLEPGVPKDRRNRWLIISGLLSVAATTGVLVQRALQMYTRKKIAEAQESTRTALAELAAREAGGDPPAKIAAHRIELQARLEALEAELVRSQLPVPSKARVLERCLLPAP